MAIWDSFIKLLSFLQFFSRIGSVFWSVMACVLTVPSFYRSITFMSVNKIENTTVLNAVTLFTDAVWILFMIMIPQTVNSLAEFVENEAKEWTGKLIGPGKLTFFLCVIPVVMVHDIYYTINLSKFSLNHTSLALQFLATLATSVALLVTYQYWQFYLDV